MDDQTRQQLVDIGAIRPGNRGLITAAQPDSTPAEPFTIERLAITIEQLAETLGVELHKQP